MKQVTENEPVPPSLLTGLPRDLETICLTSLRKEPARRYATAERLVEDLRRFQADYPGWSVRVPLDVILDELAA